MLLWNECSLFCEYAYVIDFDEGVLEVYSSFNKKELALNERFYKMAGLDQGNKDYSLISLCKRYSFTDATPEAMKQLEKELNDEDE